LALGKAERMEAMSPKQKFRMLQKRFAKAVRSGQAHEGDILRSHNGVQLGRFHCKYRGWMGHSGEDCVTLEGWLS